MINATIYVANSALNVAGSVKPDMTVTSDKSYTGDAPARTRSLQEILDRNCDKCKPRLSDVLAKALVRQKKSDSRDDKCDERCNNPREIIHHSAVQPVCFIP